MSKVTLLLAEDHHLVRQGLRTLLNTEPDFDVVGEVADGLEVTDQVERLKPDLLLLDVQMPGLDGLEVTRQVRQRVPATRILVLSMYANEAYVMRALLNGAAGYILKSATAEALAEAIRTVAAGRRYLYPPLSERAIDAYIQQAQTSPLDIYETLTNREREVLQLAAEGFTNAQIAERLCISVRTVEVHRARVLHKLDLHSQTDLVRYALRRGILPLDS
jgi:DNA-binding NarL/FixJ family response regulator